MNKKETPQFIRVVRGIVTFFLVNAGWVLFRADNIHQAAGYFHRMFDFSASNLVDLQFIQYVGEYWIFIVIGLMYSFALFKKMRSLAEDKPALDKLCSGGSLIVYPVLFIISISYLAIGSYNPFIYFNF